MPRRYIPTTNAVAALLLFASLSGCTKKVPVQPPAPPPLIDHSIILSWTQSFANNPPCSATLTTSCIAGFDEGYLAGGTTQTQLHQDAASVCTGQTQPEACTATFNATLPIGSIVFYVATTYKDQNGAAGVTSAAISAAVQVGADAATAVTVKLNDQPLT